MDKIGVLLLVIVIISCTQNTDNESTSHAASNNLELEALYEADQEDRRSANIDWAVVIARDRQRQERIRQLLDSNLVRTSDDYANAAMVFQHGADTSDSGLAVRLMKKAVELDTSRNKWLLAAAIDRDLMRRNLPQIYGTQYTRMGADQPWQLYEIDTTKVTDEQRKAFGVETLAEQRAKVRMMNKKKLSELLDSKMAVDDIIALVRSSDLENSEYNLSERGINSLGYLLTRQDNMQGALKVFKLNTELYPEGFNTFDSYGECLLKIGKTAEAITAYERSLELNPNNENAKTVLAEIK